MHSQTSVSHQMYGPYYKNKPQFEYRNAMGTVVPINYQPSNLTNADQLLSLSMARTSRIRLNE